MLSSFVFQEQNGQSVYMLTQFRLMPCLKITLNLYYNLFNDTVNLPRLSL
jgi:hypothetical protein